MKFANLKPAVEKAGSDGVHSPILRSIDAVASTLRAGEGGCVFNGGGDAVAVGEISLRIPGFVGRVDVRYPGAAGLWPLKAMNPRVSAAMERTRVHAQMVIGIRGTGPGGASWSANRTWPWRGEVMEIQVPTEEGFGQALLAEDGHGTMSWHLPVAQLPGSEQGSKGSSATYRLPLDRCSLDAVPGPPGLLEATALEALTVVKWRLVEAGIGLVDGHYARRWEQTHRPYALRSVGPAGAVPMDCMDGQAEALHRIGAGRCLLLLHGALSTTNETFSELSDECLQALNELYQHRIIAFDHPTIADDPIENAERLLARLPRDVPVDVDILCHGRGGLVARVLAEKAGALGYPEYRCDVGKVLFVATPNAGTELASSENLLPMLDTYTNLSAGTPGATTAGILDGVLTVLKVVAGGGTENLVGLRAMSSEGSFLRSWLNSDHTTATRYSTMASDYLPVGPNLRNAGLRGLGAVRTGAANDLVVPASSLSPPGCDLVEHRTLRPEAGVHHLGFFGNSTVDRNVVRWMR